MSAWVYRCKVCDEMFTAEQPHDMCEPCYLEILGRAVRYEVKCDECKQAIRYTDSVRESAEGGTCAECRAMLAAGKEA